MARTLSEAFREALTAQETGEVVIFLLEIDHADLAEPLRLSSDPTGRLTDSNSPPVELDPVQYGTISNGETYYFVPMQLVPPADMDGEAPQARLVIDNVDRGMVALLRGTSEPATVVIRIVLGTSLDDVEIEYPEMSLYGAEYDAQSITISLGIDAMSIEPFPAGAFTPSGFNGLFS